MDKEDKQRGRVTRKGEEEECSKEESLWGHDYEMKERDEAQRRVMMIMMMTTMTRTRQRGRVQRREEEGARPWLRDERGRREGGKVRRKGTEDGV